MDNPANDQGGPATPPGKPDLRAMLRARRRAFAATSPIIDVPAAFRERLAPGTIVASYAPVGGEVDPAPFEAAALAAGCRIALPHVVDRATPIEFLVVEPGVTLVAGPFGLANPPVHWRRAAPDVVLTPLVGFDRWGGRLGQGAGHYDRAFVAYPLAWRVGLAWSVQEVATLPVDPWDISLHAVATEREWIAVA